MSKTAEKLDQKIWSTWLQMDRFNSNPEAYIKPFREIAQEYADQQLAEFKEKMYPEIGKAYNRLMELGYDGDLNILAIMHELQQKFKV